MIINETEKNVLQEYYFRKIDDTACHFITYSDEEEPDHIEEGAEKIMGFAKQILEIEKAYRIDQELEKKSGREEQKDE